MLMLHTPIRLCLSESTIIFVQHCTLARGVNPLTWVVGVVAGLQILPLEISLGQVYFTFLAKDGSYILHP